MALAMHFAAVILACYVGMIGMTAVLPLLQGPSFLQLEWLNVRLQKVEFDLLAHSPDLLIHSSCILPRERDGDMGGCCLNPLPLHVPPSNCGGVYPPPRHLAQRFQCRIGVFSTGFSFPYVYPSHAEADCIVIFLDVGSMIKNFLVFSYHFSS